MVAFLCFFEHSEVRFHFILFSKRRAVNSREHLVVLVATPVRACDTRQFESFNFSSRRKMRTTAQIGESTLLKATIDAAIAQAVAESVEQGIKGKETTPFLLARVSELTGGNSLASNIQLVFNNAKVAAQTAAVYATL